MKILLPVDGSSYTQRMLTYVVEHEELLSANHDYTLFTAVGAVPPHITKFLDRAMVDGHYLSQAEGVLAPLKAFVERKGWKVRTAHTVGAPADAVAALCESEHFDLIVMGTHGHSSLGNMVLGSVATGVIARCKVPVLLVR